MAHHCCDVKLCAHGALKRRWAPQTHSNHKGYLSEYMKKFDIFDLILFLNFVIVTYTKLAKV